MGWKPTTASYQWFHINLKEIRQLCQIGISSKLFNAFCHQGLAVLKYTRNTHDRKRGAFVPRYCTSSLYPNLSTTAQVRLRSMYTHYNAALVLFSTTARGCIVRCPRCVTFMEYFSVSYLCDHGACSPLKMNQHKNCVCRTLTRRKDSVLWKTQQDIPFSNKRSPRTTKMFLCTPM